MTIPKIVKGGLYTILFLGSFFYARANYAAPEPIISLTFDDGWRSQYEYAAPIIKAANQKATVYVPDKLIGTPEYMTWENVVSMVNEGWEVGGHTVDHLELPTLTPEQIQQQVKENFDTLAAHGLEPVSFASPYGAYDPTVIASIASYFENHRNFHDIGYNAWPYNKYLLYVQQITNQTTLADVEAWINEAVANNYWLILVFHDILPQANIETGNTYAWSTENLQALMDLLQTKSIKTQTIAQALNMKDSLFPNFDFKNGIADGWITPTPTQVMADNGGHGAVPTPVSSVKMIGAAESVHLFSPKVDVASTTEYGIRLFTNSINLTSGEFGFYMDEYDTWGNWVSWKFLGFGTLNNVVDESFAYQPSPNVAAASLKVYMNGGANGHIYVDNAFIFEMGEGKPLPTPQPIASLIPNPPLQDGDFTLGLLNGWYTSNPDQVVHDKTGKGILPSIETTIKMIGSTVAGHLFSPKVQVNNTGNYNVSAYLDTKEQTAGEAGLYIDEFDKNENWISGKWLGYQAAGTSGDLTFNYKPSSDLVFAASIQTYLTSNSTGNVYADNINLKVAEAIPDPVNIPFANHDFSEGLKNWTIDNNGQVTVSSDGHGDVPSIDSSIKMSGGDNAAHLFSPKVNVNDENYDITVYTDASELTSGEIGYYVDEYDTDKNWISGKWLGYQEIGNKGSLKYGYKPSSASVKSARVQVYLTAGANGNAYIDNLQMKLAPIVQAPVALPLPNTDFINGINDGWTTNYPSRVTYSNDNHGLVPTIDSSIKMTGGEGAVHLFSPKALVASTTSYNVNAFIDAVEQTAGEVGVYIDEYDADGNWISGKWLGYQTSGQSSSLSFPYIPTSGSVNSAMIQTYLTDKSAGTVYLDNIEMKAAN